MRRIVYGAGRLGRLHYLYWQLGLTAASYVLFAITDDPGNWFIGLVVLAWLTGAQATRRAHDLSFSGWFVVLLFVPIINILAQLYLLFAPSYELQNKYGPPQSGPYVLNATELDAAKAHLAAQEIADAAQHNANLTNEDGTFKSDGIFNFDP